MELKGIWTYKYDMNQHYIGGRRGVFQWCRFSTSNPKKVEMLLPNIDNPSEQLDFKSYEFVEAHIAVN